MPQPNLRDRWKVIYDGAFPTWSERHRIGSTADGITHVYIAFVGDTCLYIGTSTAWQNRFDKHRITNTWYALADRLVLLEVTGSKRDRQKLWRAGYAVEQSLIAELNPVYNVKRPKGCVA